MKNPLIILLVVFLSGMLFACEDEQYLKQQDYPVVVLDSAVMLNQTSLKLFLTNYKSSRIPCSEYGVIWSASGRPTFSDSIQRMEGDVPKGNFSISLNNRFNENFHYQLIFYVRSDIMVFLNPIAMPSPLPQNPGGEVPVK